MMKLAMLVLTLALPISSASKDRRITYVVKYLQHMLENSQAQGETERVAYAKFKCSCDNNTKAKEAAIDAGEKKILLLSSEIQELHGMIAKLSEESAQLKAELEENEASDSEATSIRDNSNEKFLAEEEDLTAAITQLSNAIETLAEVNADQTEATAAMDSQKFMASYDGPRALQGASLLRLKSNVKSALTAAAALSMDPRKQQVVTSFLQAPFTGSYTSQSVEVMGILKNMKDTFESNLQAARATEAAEVKAYKALMVTIKGEHKEMGEAYDKKQGELSSHEVKLATTRGTLAAIKKEKKDAEDFLAEMVPLCAEKAEHYKKYNQLRVDEELAISEAISILNSDDAFATFGATQSATTYNILLQHKGDTAVASFVQLASVSRHTAEKAVKDEVVKQLRKVKSARLEKVASRVQANPFDAVLKAIADMILVIDEEEKSDREKMDFCSTTGYSAVMGVEVLKSGITFQDMKIANLEEAINNPETGLLAQISENEASLRNNKKTQAAKTSEFNEVTAEFKADVNNLHEALEILTKAEGVLTKYYQDMEQALTDHYASEAEKDAPSEGMPTGYDPKMHGQSMGGFRVLNMLMWIKEATIKEEDMAKADYGKEKEAFEKFMGELKSEEVDLSSTLTSMQNDVAFLEDRLLLTKKDRADTQKHLDKTEAYVAKIKAGCDFIYENLPLRNSMRAEEKKQLGVAEKLIKGSPSYKAAVTKAQVQSYGDCKPVCPLGAEGSLKCKACMAGVTEVGYCAGHPNQIGCES